MDSDPGGPKTWGSRGSGSGFPTLVFYCLLYFTEMLPGAEGAAPDVAGDAELRVEILAGGQVHLQLVQHDRVRHLYTHVHSG
jgi:hypothetical protein